jgi:hypothetical protein
MARNYEASRSSVLLFFCNCGSAISTHWEIIWSKLQPRPNVPSLATLSYVDCFSRTYFISELLNLSSCLYLEDFSLKS